jgi:hypothetical protein
MAASTRPLNLGEILDRAVQLFRRNFLLLVGIGVPPAAVMALITGAVVIFFSTQIAALTPAAGQPAGQPPSPEAMIVIGMVFIGFVVIGVPLLLVTFAMALSALNFAASQVNRGESTTIRASYGYAFKHFWRHIGILFLQSLLSWVVPYFVFVAILVVGTILAGLLAKSGAGAVFAPLFVVAAVVLIIALLVVGVLLWVRFSLAFPVSVAEGKKSWPSMQRSGQLTKGSRGRIFVMFLLVWVLSIVASVALAIPVDIGIALTMRKALTAGQGSTFYLTLVQVVNLAVAFLVRIFVMPIYALALVLFYADQRTRMEGYDIEQLMAQAGWTEPPPLPLAQNFPSIPPPLVATEVPSVDAVPIETTPVDAVSMNGSPQILSTEFVESEVAPVAAVSVDAISMEGHPGVPEA